MSSEPSPAGPVASGPRQAGSAPLRTWVVTHHYPSELEPNRGAFVRALVREWVTRCASQLEVAVLAPEPLWSPAAPGWRRGVRLPASDEDPVLVRPVFPSFSARRLGGFSTARLTLSSFAWTARRAARQMPFEPEILYAHFLFPAAFTATALARKRGVPVVAAIGESDFETWHSQFGRELLSKTACGLAGLVCVSQTNREHCLDLGVRDERILVAPNAVDTERFRPGDRDAARRRLGLPLDRPIIAFTGYFVERKGPLRVLEALQRQPEVGAVFIGDGPQRPVGEQVLFAGRQDHDAVPDWLRAADLFVLPTTAEGSPNAVLEAMACGRAVVSSDIPALLETVPPEAGRLVDPLDVSAIDAAVREILADPIRRAAMERAARAEAERGSLARRAETISRWLRQVRDGAVDRKAAG